MIINRHNYEEFFLLYVDNELSPEDRAAVENFVQQNGDLAGEMEMLKHAILPGEKIEFEQKEHLYNHAEGIGLDNYEEYFLLSVDNELSEKENEEVEKFILTHPELQNEYMSLGQTRLEPEKVTFAGKEKLYRKESKERRVIFATWIRVSVAAAIIGLAAITWIFTQNNLKPSVNNIVASEPKSIKTPVEEIKQPVTNEAIARLHEKVSQKIAEEAKVKVARKHEVQIVNNAVAMSPGKDQSNEAVATTNKKTQAAKTVIEAPKSSDEAVVSARTTNKNNLPAVNDDRINATFTNKPEEGTPLATQAVYREIDNQDGDDDRSFYIGSAEINKNKLKGFFKKAAGLIGKKTNKSDGERTLKIAGFEIKSK